MSPQNFDLRKSSHPDRHNFAAGVLRNLDNRSVNNSMHSRNLVASTSKLKATFGWLKLVDTSKENFKPSDNYRTVDDSGNINSVPTTSRRNRL